ncbi:S8 family serine peptidase [Pyxidicoccus parkwayensis]|uniref:S8 family serine peptidase n=1 Tax=Pyxidicoccus parkwayensis TaxID=2813578 RepID=A0ABX7NWN7_9BACT|nr:S8 family serine peptidase [Pyxidicoccus parkwaysis]QSQ21814.1 S8 family serine peptidase [Pyxidicoccus parkwaysis]
MRRWGLVGLVACVACAPENTSYRNAQGGVCPNVSVGALEEAPPSRNALPGGPDSEGRSPYIVRFREGGVSAAATVHQLGGRVTATFRSVPAVAARLTEQERGALARDSRVESIEEDQVWHSMGASTAPVMTFASRAVTGNVTGEYTAGLKNVQANLVWDQNNDGQLDPGRPTGRGVRVCVIDSGLDLAHPELRDAVVAKHDFLDGDDEPWDGSPNGSPDNWGTGHGTHVAGIIAARAGQGAGGGHELEKGRGLMGVAPDAELVIARVLDIYGSTQMSFVLEALEYCQSQGAKVASLSLGGGFASRTSLDAFKAAHDSGMLVVAASGNDGGRVVSYPASDPSVVAVGAVDDKGRRARFSTGGEDLALVAPGVEVLSTFPTRLGSLATVEPESRTEPILARALLYALPGEQNLALVDCGGGESVDSCEARDCNGFIAYVRPGRVPVERAMVNVMRQGAKAVVFVNEDVERGADILALPRHRQWAPAVTVNQAAGTVLERIFGTPVRIQVERADYAYMSGTSMAAPHVSGVAALLFSAHPSATPDQVKEAMLSTALGLGDAEGYGKGLVQAKAALDALSLLP